MAYLRSGDLAVIPAAAGKVLQVVSTTLLTTTSVAASTTTANFINIPGLYVTITPASTSNKIYLLSHLLVNYSNATEPIYLRFGGGNSSNAVGASAGSRSRAIACMSNYAGSLNTGAQVSFVYLDSPATTSAVTYYTQLTGLNAAGTIYVNRTADDADYAWRGRAASTITAMEIEA